MNPLKVMQVSLSNIYTFIYHCGSLNYIEDNLHRKKIDESLVKMLVTDLQPVEDKGFQEFLKVVDPKYIPPSRRSIMRDHLPNLYSSAKQN